MSAPSRETEPGTDRLLDALVRDAEPVERIYPTGRVLLGVAAVYVAWWGVGIWWLGGVRDAATVAEVIGDGFFVGLVSSIAGATGAGVAAREPGRERLGRGALVLLGIGVAAMIATFLADLGEDEAGISLALEAHCMTQAAKLGVVPAGVLLAVALGGWRGRPVLTSLAAACSGAALGGIAVHVTCPAQGAWHVMLGHFLLPLALALAIGGVGAAVWRWLDRR